MRMFSRILVMILAIAWSGELSAASKPHVVTFGKWTTIDLLTGPAEDQLLHLKVRPLYVDSKLREFTFGMTHEITERVFAVQRMIRVNDSLPSDAATTPQWVWQRGGWLIVDRGSGHVSQASLPQFDPEVSSAGWYRDYVGYCGVSSDGKKIYATVIQLGRRKAILEKALAEVPGDSGSVQCTTPTWQRHPARITFTSQDDKKFTYVVRGHAVEVVAQDEDDKDDTSE